MHTQHAHTHTQTHTHTPQAAVQSAERLSSAESLWLLHVAVTTQQYLPHEDWGRLLLVGVLAGQDTTEAAAAMPLAQQHLLLTCMVSFTLNASTYVGLGAWGWVVGSIKVHMWGCMGWAVREIQARVWGCMEVGCRLYRSTYVGVHGVGCMSDTSPNVGVRGGGL